LQCSWASRRKEGWSEKKMKGRWRYYNPALKITTRNGLAQISFTLVKGEGGNDKGNQVKFVEAQGKNSALPEIGLARPY